MNSRMPAAPPAAAGKRVTQPAAGKPARCRSPAQAAPRPRGRRVAHWRCRIAAAIPAWRGEERIGDRGEAAAAADVGRLLHCGCGLQRRLSCRDPGAARVEGKIRFLHIEYDALLLTIKLQISGKEGLGRAVDIRGTSTEVQQQPIQPQQRLEHTRCEPRTVPILVVIRQAGIAGHANGAERRQIGSFGDRRAWQPQRVLLATPRVSPGSFAAQDRSDAAGRRRARPELRGSRSRPSGERLQRGLPAGNARRFFRGP